MENLASTILIVDDNPNNLKVLGGVLNHAGYQFRMAKSGQLALNIIEKTKPDLILLDIQMPEMDGFETCVRIKADLLNATIPIIFLTANTDSDSVTKAFNVGGVDYVTKPFNSEELLARISTHIKLKLQTEELTRQSAAKDKFFSIISHDLKNPIANIIGFSELIKDEADNIQRLKLSTYINYIHDSANFSLEILHNLLEWARIQRGSIQSVKSDFNLSDLLKNNIQGHEGQALAKSINLDYHFENNLLTHADEKMISTVIRNLLSNAIKFTPKGGRVTISSQLIELQGKKIIETKIKDTGIGIPEEDLSRLFKIEQNYSSKGTNNESGTGLGLILCQEFINQNDGHLRVESLSKVGSSFIFDLQAV